MTKIQFQCDYNEGAHPLILQRLLETNMEQTVGYGMDDYCHQAREAIRRACQRPDADVHFLVGGTQTNATVISSVLRPYQGVVCAETGHINVHETGAIEHTGHKCIALPSHQGLVRANELEALLATHFDDAEPEHCVQPGMVYISYSAETGMLYKKAELIRIKEVCRQYGLPLFVDGARLGYGLMSPKSDLTLPELAQIADIFYIGGTKQGALFGEALVITNGAYKKDFRYNIKQNGGMLAKGRLLGLQFLTLFTDNLYFDIARHAIDEAMRIKEALVSKGYQLFMDSPTNQQFVILTDHQYEALSHRFVLSLWQRYDAKHVVVRICTSWATLPENVDKLIEAL